MRFASVLCLTLAAAAMGCTVRTQSRVETTPITARIELSQPVQEQIQVQAAPPQAGVTIVESQCQAGASEACNGLDDNCDGRIDEGCGWQSGQIQITSAWNTGADIDLYVTDPFGETIYYGHRQASSGGVLDHDARGACVSGGDTIENVYWTSPRPPPGTYQVELHYWGSCGVAGPTPAQVSISVGGRIIGVYNVTLFDQQRLPVAVFTI
jgi:hypothetical protein